MRPRSSSPSRRTSRRTPTTSAQPGSMSPLCTTCARRGSRGERGAQEWLAPTAGPRPRRLAGRARLSVGRHPAMQLRSPAPTPGIVHHPRCLVLRRPRACVSCVFMCMNADECHPMPICRIRLFESARIPAILLEREHVWRCGAHMPHDQAHDTGCVRAVCVEEPAPVASFVTCVLSNFNVGLDARV